MDDTLRVIAFVTVFSYFLYRAIKENRAQIKRLESMLEHALEKNL